MADDKWSDRFTEKKSTIKTNLVCYENARLLYITGKINSGQLDCLIKKALIYYQKSKLCPHNCLSRRINYDWIYRSFNTINSETNTDILSVVEDINTFARGLLWVNHPSLAWLLLGLTIDGHIPQIINNDPEIQRKLDELIQERLNCHWLDEERLDRQIVHVKRQLYQPLRLNSVSNDMISNYDQRLKISTGWVYGPDDMESLIINKLYAISNVNITTKLSDIKHRYLIFCSPTQQKIGSLEIELKAVNNQTSCINKHEERVTFQHIVIMTFPSELESIYAYNILPQYNDLHWNYMTKKLHQTFDR